MKVLVTRHEHSYGFSLSKEGYRTKPLRITGLSLLLYLILSISVSQNVVHGQHLPVNRSDTLEITLREADSLFLQNNLYLLASSMNIEAQKAQIIQARTYPNPILIVDVNAYDPEAERAFHVGRTGQKALQLEQLIILGGKRKAEIELAKTNARIAELEFQQLLRQLKFRLRSDLFTIGQQALLLDKYNTQLRQLGELIAAYEEQAANGHAPLKDVVRLKGAYLKLNNDRAEILEEFFNTQTSLQTLLRTTAIIKFQFSENEVEKYIQERQLSEIQAEAWQHRPEYLILGQNRILAQQYLAYQRRVAIPDISLFAAYDQRSGAFEDQISVGLSIPLPLGNRNQGNIKTSHFKAQEIEYAIEAMRMEITSGIQSAFALYTQIVSEYQKVRTLYNEDFETTVKGMVENFQKRNVSIIEFIDFFEAYNEVLTEMTRIKTQLVISAERLNLLTGKDIF
ncbi:MAG: TolC family protein [Bacteroidota bacterium]